MHTILLSVLTSILLLTTGGYQIQQGVNNLEILASEFVKLIVMKDFKNAVEKFDDTMRDALPAEKLQQTWSALIAQAGIFKNQVGTRTEKFQQYNIVYVTCEFENSMLDVKVVFNNENQIAGLFFVPAQPKTEQKLPDYVKTESFVEKEVTVGSGEWSLPGTLTLPSTGKNFAAVVLVHGSGPHDRDQTIGQNKPFRDIALGLASRGIAVLRYDKRTYAYSGKLSAVKENITTKEETIDDVLTAVSLLRSEEKINTKKIFILGHSLGGMLIPRIGALDSKIAGFIIMAGPTRPLEDLILAQMMYIFLLDNNLTDDEKKQLEEINKQVQRVKNPQLSIETPFADLPLNIPARYWLDLRNFKPAEAAKELKQPILILHGERDYQVTIEDFDGWKKALSDRKNVTFKLYPKLNHLFVEGEGKSSPAEYQTAGNIARVVIDDIVEWIKNQ